VPAVIIVRFEDKKRSIFLDEFEQIDPASVTRRFQVGKTSSPQQRLTDCFLFTPRKPILMLVVSEHLKCRFLVHDFASKRIHQTNVVVHVCANERVPIVIPGEEFVDDYSFINKIDMKGAAAQLAAPVFEIVWRADDGRNTMRRKMIPQ
jgi:hypothetical protein